MTQDGAEDAGEGNAGADSAGAADAGVGDAGVGEAGVGEAREGGAGASGAEVDPELRAALAEAPSGERLRAVLVLRQAAGGASAGTPSGTPATPPHPADYPNRTTWRSAMIDHRRGETADALGPARRALADLGLTVRGGHTSAAVVVEGPAAALRTALDLPTIAHAGLDREHRQTPKRRPGRRTIRA